MRKYRRNEIGSRKRISDSLRLQLLDSENINNRSSAILVGLFFYGERLTFLSENQLIFERLKFFS